MIRLKTDPPQSRPNLVGMQPQVVLALMVADAVARKHGYDGIRITSVTDPPHSEHSKHHSGCAVDFTLWKGPMLRPGLEAYTPELVEELRTLLGVDFDVVLEHSKRSGAVWLHVEWDPRSR